MSKSSFDLSVSYHDFQLIFRPALTLNGRLNKENYMLKMMLLHPNLATNARVVFNRCSLLITILTYHASKT